MLRIRSWNQSAERVGENSPKPINLFFFKSRFITIISSFFSTTKQMRIKNSYLNHLMPFTIKVFWITSLECTPLVRPTPYRHRDCVLLHDNIRLHILSRPLSHYTHRIRQICHHQTISRTQNSNSSWKGTAMTHNFKYLGNSRRLEIHSKTYIEFQTSTMLNK